MRKTLRSVYLPATFVERTQTRVPSVLLNLREDGDGVGKARRQEAVVEVHAHAAVV